jgi:hypothetical protein
MAGKACAADGGPVGSSSVSLSAEEADAALLAADWPTPIIALDVETTISLGLEAIGAELAGDSFDWLAATAAIVAEAVTAGAGWVWSDAAVFTPLLDD